MRKGRALRDVYGEALKKYGAQNENVVVLDADVSSSTKSSIFAEAFPQRFFNVGIAEANMVHMAAGLATTGKIPFVNTFAVFLTSIGLIGARAFGSYSQLNLKLMGAMAVFPMPLMVPATIPWKMWPLCALPHFQVFVASDEVLTDWLVKNAIETEGPMYIRLSRDSTLNLYEPGTEFQTGKGMIVREGSDATIIACGVMVGQAVLAAEELAQDGISVRVVDMFTIKPIDRELIIESAEQTGVIISAEEHNIYGGLGGAVAEVLAASGVKAIQKFVGVQDVHAESGPYDELLQRYGLGVDSVVQAVKEALVQKRG